MRRLSIAASASPTPRPAAKAAHGDPNRTIRAATRPFRPSKVPVSTVNGADGAAATAASAASPPTSAERQGDEPFDRQSDEPRSFDVRRDRLQRAPVPRALERPGRERGKRRSQCDDEERTNLDARAGDRDETVATDLVERDRIRENIRRTGEGRADHAAERERDRQGRSDPAQGRAAQEIGLDEEDVRRRSEHRRTTASATPSAERKRPGARLVWLTGAVPAATSSVAKTAKATRSPNAKYTIPVSR